MKKIRYCLFLAVCLFMLSLSLRANAAENQKLNKKSVNIICGYTATVQTEGTFSGKVRYTSTNTKIATVNSKTGKIKGLSVGVCKIKCTFPDGTKKSCKVNVVKRYKQTNLLTAGHRGYKSKYPENTLAAFKGAFKSGFSGIECDAYESDNGDIMIFHDATTGRMCSKDMPITSVNKENRKNYPIKSGANVSKYSTQLIPTLEETAAVVQKYQGTLYLHLKQPEQYSKEGIQKIINVLNQYGIQENTVVFCTNVTPLKKLHSVGIETALSINSTDKAAINKQIEKAINNGFQYFILCSSSAFTNEIVEKCHENGIKIGCYFLDNNSQAAKLMNLNVDFAFSNYKLFQK